MDGLLTSGSTGAKAVSLVSDYDLIVILRETPVPLRVALTTIDHRLTDVIFVVAQEIERISQPAALTGNTQWDSAQLLRWLRTGHIIFDRSGALRAAQAVTLSTAEADLVDSDLYDAWFSTNYNVRQTRRMLGSDDPAYQMAVDLRLLFSLHDVWRNYFVARRLGIYGDKAQAKFLATNDPEFLQAFRHCLAEADRKSKFKSYEGLARWALAPLGGLCDEGITSVMPEPDETWTADTVVKALSFWQSLVGTPE